VVSRIGAPDSTDPGLMTPQIDSLQVLIANERDSRLDAVTRLVEDLGHVVVGRALDVEQVAPLTRQLDPDVALVGLGLDSEHALTMIARLVHEASCPVIALLDTKNPAYVEEAAKRGVFAYLTLGTDSDELRSALDITLRRFAEFSNLQGAFARRAVIEQAKGILMARNNIDADAAYELLKARSQKTGTKISEIAKAITESHTFFPSESLA
jgi:two-component system, response regulator PdtaR